MVISPDQINLFTGMISFLFTLLIFSYVLGDNPLFRVAVYIFIGVSAGYIAVVASWQVVMLRLVYPFMSAMSSGTLLQVGLILVPLLGALMLLVFPHVTGLGRIPMAFLVGVGAAVTIAGAVIGTIIPQIQGTINAFDMGVTRTQNIGFVEAVSNATIILAGTVLTLSYFHFSARQKADGSMHRLGAIEAMAWGGRVFIGIALGAVFAGVYAAALTALIERISSLIIFITNFLGNFL